MKRFYLDSNVLLDFLLDRTPHAATATNLLAAAKKGRVTLLISSLTYTTAHYVMSKAIGKKAALLALADLHTQLTTAAVDSQVIGQALQAELPDFEDAVQLFAALAANADVIVTRDPKGFPNSPIPILDPLAALNLLLPSA